MKKLFAVLIVVFMVSFTFAGEKVLFDNTHAQTAGSAHWTIYTGFSDFAYDLERSGYEVDTLDHGPVKYSILKRYRIFIIPEPNNSFSSQEIEDIKRFVKEGGGLFLIADHEGADRNHNGWDAVRIYNKFSSEFGFKFDYKTFSEHPLYGKRVECSITEGVDKVGSWGGTSINITNDSIAKGLIHVSSSNGGNPFIAVSVYGAGRVAAVGDSSPFDDGTMSHKTRKLYDNYNMKQYNHKKMALNLVDFLAGFKGNDIDFK